VSSDVGEIKLNAVLSTVVAPSQRPAVRFFITSTAGYRYDTLIIWSLLHWYHGLNLAF